MTIVLNVSRDAHVRRAQVGLESTRELAATCSAPAIWCLALSLFGFGLAKSPAYSNAVYVGSVLMNLGMLSLALATIVVYPIRRKMFHDRVLALYSLVTLWGIVVVFNGFRFEFRHIRDMWGIANFAWAYLMPAVMILGGALPVWRRLFHHVCLMSCVLIPALIVGQAIRFRTDFGLAAAAPQVLLFWCYLPRYGRRAVLLSSFVALSFAILYSTRTSVGSIGLLILCAAFLEFFRPYRQRSARRLSIMLGFTLLCCAGLYVAEVQEIPGGGKWVNSRLDAFFDELGKNTRTNENANLYMEFLEDVTPGEIIIGRGCLGRYTVERDVTDLGRMVKERTDIECGYFQMVLKGGLLSLAGMLALALPAIYLGMFRTRNSIPRACALIVLVRLIEMVPFGLPAARVDYLIFWLAIGCCWSPPIRRMSEHELVRFFHGTSMRLGVPA